MLSRPSPRPEPPLLADVAPGFAAELAALLDDRGEPVLARAVPTLPVVELCGCKDPRCASFYTVPRCGRPDLRALVFPDSEGGHLRRQNWRRRVWIPALERAGVAYFRSYDLRHSCATLLLYEGRTLNEVAEHLGHADPGFTARTYAHVMRDASRRRRVPITEAIRTARATASRRPLVDPLGRESASRASRSAKKTLQIERAE